MSSNFRMAASCSLTVILSLLPLGFAQRTEQFAVLTGADLTRGFDLNIDTSEKKRDWMRREDGFITLTFPEKQDWASLFITVGPPVDARRPGMDFSSYQTLTFDLKGAKGGEKIEVGVVSNEDKKVGQEARVALTLTPQWKTYQVQVTRFHTENLKQLYIVTELVYMGKEMQSVSLRNVRFLK